MARAILGFFPAYGIDRWIDVYGSQEQVESSKFSAWSSFEWRQLEAWIEDLEGEYLRRVVEETEAEGLGERISEPNARTSSRGGTGGNARGRTNRPGPIRVASTDLDVIRILEAMKREGIVAHETTGPQIVAAFEWKGELNDKPENYYAARKNLMNPPSNRVVAFIACLLENAGDDIASRIVVRSLSSIVGAFCCDCFQSPS